MPDLQLVFLQQNTGCYSDLTKAAPHAEAPVLAAEATELWR